jgi:hypothetical protein
MNPYAPEVAAANPAPAAPCRRLRTLLAIHLMLCAAPLISLFIPPALWYLPLSWATYVPGMGSLMTLSFWLGMGGGRLARRLPIAAVGVGYIAVWPALVGYLQQPPGTPFTASTIKHYGAMLASMGMVLATFALGFLIARRWVTLQRQTTPSDQPRHDGIQYSLLNVLILMSLAALVLAFVKLSRSDDNLAPNPWASVVVPVLGYGVFFVNTAFAARAALGRSPLAPRIVASAVVSALLGVAMGFANGNDQGPWWLVASIGVILVIPTMIVVASLLVVRSCGYRLTPPLAAHARRLHRRSARP